MKKSVFNFVVALVALFSISVIGVNAQSLPEFLYNSESANGNISSKSVCKLDKESGLHKKHILHEYTYTEAGLPETRKTSHWNGKSQDWEMSYIITYTYDNLLSMVTLEYALWNKEDKTFNNPIEKAIYQSLTGELISSYTLYEKEDIANNWIVKEHFGINDYFIAEVRE